MDGDNDVWFLWDRYCSYEIYDLNYHNDKLIIYLLFLSLVLVDLINVFNRLRVRHVFYSSNTDIRCRSITSNRTISGSAISLDT
ncbi:hypothetical protein XBP1_2710009 [Xenorhabdus bovienii str. puntauvense]|uniref:Uncharacterized protein n=2 Tax=Xenorhabdus bovienii TaxID=40576 RepID=A0A077NFP8_XENBV|nr:hypothetical protein XBFFR1_2070023 [Xenorhabdus bovienii str. feltiae France]CDG90985.1 hypothetical protein XBFFL1_1190079 [Xenorhabdus bovienii str. feltiae Florida]CDG97649.1 hypothetical protein XBP1_2710009 [Xenorhabdus bovienii str. puntauvense]CDH26277.1 hypothetical protein XBKB1_550002 [Xenorhabdus bovienii str. kraussei Becker Underwood]